MALSGRKLVHEAKIMKKYGLCAAMVRCRTKEVALKCLFVIDLKAKDCMPFACQKDGDGNITLFTIIVSKPHNFNKMHTN
jgi:hypothetical protein